MIRLLLLWMSAKAQSPQRTQRERGVQIRLLALRSWRFFASLRSAERQQAHDPEIE
jgi:hypothetical protein